MKNKIFILSLLFLTLSFASHCAINIDNSTIMTYANTTLNIIPTSCIHFNDIDFTIQLNNPRLNDTNHLIFGQTVTNEITNSTYVAQNKIEINESKTLDYDELYINRDCGNIQIRAPSLPVKETYCAQNIDKTLGLCESYKNDITNETFRAVCESDIALNEFLNPDFNTTKISSKYNVTCFSSALPICPEPEQITVTEMIKLNINKKLKCGEKYVNDDANATLETECEKQEATFTSLEISTPQTIKTQTLAVNQNVSCQTFNIDTLRDKYFNTTCARGLPICLEQFNDACTLEEKVNGDLFGCVNRINNESQKNYNTCNSDLQQTKQKLNEKESIIAQQVVGTSGLNWTLVIVLGFVTILFSFATYFSMNRQKIDNSPPISRYSSTNIVPKVSSDKIKEIHEVKKDG